MSWNNAVLTKLGENLLSGMLNGAKLTFTRVVLGDKTVKDELLPTQTSVFSPIPAPALIAGKREAPSKNGTEIIIQIRNDGVAETTRMRQIGLFAQTEHDDEVMLAILQDETGEEIPAYADFSQFEISLALTIGISRTNNISVIVSPSVYATAAQLEAVKSECAKIKYTAVETVERDPNKPSYGLDESGGGEAENVTLNAKTYTGTAEVTLIVNDNQYDAENMTANTTAAVNGTMILEEAT